MGWKIYFVCLAVLVVGSFFGRIFLFAKKPGVVKRFDLLQSIIGIVALVGVYGFAYNVKIANQVVWVAVSALVIVFWLLEFFQPKTTVVVEKIGLAKASLLFGAMALITLPGYVALISYAFSQSLWETSS
jgi:hypothetical protein